MEAPPPPPPGKAPEEMKKAAEEPANDQKAWSNPLKMLAAAAAGLKSLKASGDADAGADKSVVMEDAAAVAVKGKEPEVAKSVPSRMVDLAKDVLGFAGPAKRGEKRKADSPAEEEEPVKKQKPDPVHPLIKAEQAAGTGPVIDETRTFRFAGNAYSRLPNPQFTQRKLKRDWVDVPPLDRFIRENVSSGNKWVFSKQIGEGGYGTAELWYLMDKDDEVLDEIVVKHCSISYRDYYDWRFWENGWKTADNMGNNFDRKRVLEAAIHDRLTKAGPWYETGISKFITDWLAPDRRSYKLYLEYARLGSLDNIVPMSNSRSRKAENWEIPEPVIWYWLHCLMRAALTMQQSFAELSGDQLPPLDTVVNWKPIVHFDIKEPNIIVKSLGERGNDIVLNEGLEWPMPLLIDFGLAIELLDSDDWDNPKDYRCGGTDGYMAPEQLKLRHIDGPKKGKRFEYGSHTNVFAIGLTIYNLIRGDHSSRIDKITEWGRANMHLRGNDHCLVVHESEDSEYSDELIDFLAKCTARNPDDRPKLHQELLDYLRKECLHWYKWSLPGEDGKDWGPFSGFADKTTKISKAFKVYVSGWIPSIKSGAQYANNYGEPGYCEGEEDDVVTRELVAEGEEDAEGESDEDVVMVPGTKSNAAEGEQDAEGEPDDDVEMVPGTKPDVAMGEGA